MILIVAALTEMWKFQIRKSEHQSSNLGRSDRAIIENDNANMFRAQVRWSDHPARYISDFIIAEERLYGGLVTLSSFGYKTSYCFDLILGRKQN